MDNAEVQKDLQFHPELIRLVSELSQYQWAAQLHDHRWRLVWSSTELNELAPALKTARVKTGQHMIEGFMMGLELFTEDSRERWVRANVPFVLAAGPESAAEIAAMLGEDLGPLVETLTPQSAPLRWFSCIDLAHMEFSGRMHYFVESVFDQAGELIGYLMIYAPDLPSKLLNLLIRGDRRMHERMAELVDPAPRAAAVLYADIEGSGMLSRHMSSAAYFRLIRSLRSGFDQTVGQFGGVLGKHAGDGVTALFLTEQLGSDSASARAAIEAARVLGDVARNVTATLTAEGLPLTAHSCLLNVGVHWGGTLFIGQVSSEGRLEITALGDEMNEAARIEQTARNGRLLASKSLIERLTEIDATALGLDSQGIRYEVISEIPGASQKALRDAGFVAVAEVAWN